MIQLLWDTRGISYCGWLSVDQWVPVWSEGRLCDRRADISSFNCNILWVFHTNTHTGGAGVVLSVQCLTTDWATGVRSLTEAEDFSSSLCVQTGSGANPASCTFGTGSPFSGVERGRGVMLTAHPHLVPRLSMSRSYTSSPPQAPSWHVAGQLYFFLTIKFQSISSVFTSVCLTQEWKWSLRTR
jgi:hypothetical protein